MRYEDNIIDDVQAANDIVDVISQYVPLKRVGRNFKACCPFHQEKTPSFMVHPEKQIFHCFGCGAGGNVFSFLMRHENMSFPEALRQLAERAHIRLPERTVRKEEGPSEAEQIYEVYRLATEYYHAQFLDADCGKQARDYLKKRGFVIETAKEFHLGWSPPLWRGLFEFLGKKGFSELLLAKSGLIQRSSQGHFYDAFRDRLLFPIHNLQGKVVGFGGRVIGESEGPKYLNSPENPIFHKRRELFGLHLAKKYVDRELPRILVVEGYLDFLRLYTQGFRAAVATLGTSLTEEHVQVLKRFADEAIVIYDGDKAGESASLRGLEVFLEGGMNVKLIRMPKGYDPDDFLKEKGVEAFQALVASAKDFFDYKLEVAFEKYSREDSLGLLKITGEFLETLAKIKNPILLNHYLKRLAGALHLDENSLRAELAKLQKKTAERASRFTDAGQRDAPKLLLPRGMANAANDEVLLLGLMIEDASLAELACRDLTESDFSEGLARDLFRLLRMKNHNREPIKWAQVLHPMNESSWERRLREVSTLDWSPEDRKKAFADCFNTIKRKQLERRLEELRRSIAKAEKEGNDRELSTYTKEYQSLLPRHKA
jgi:DNA primase